MFMTRLGKFPPRTDCMRDSESFIVACLVHEHLIKSVNC